MAAPRRDGCPALLTTVAAGAAALTAPVAVSDGMLVLGADFPPGVHMTEGQSHLGICEWTPLAGRNTDDVLGGRRRPHHVRDLAGRRGGSADRLLSPVHERVSRAGVVVVLRPARSSDLDRCGTLGGGWVSGWVIGVAGSRAWRGWPWPA